MGLMVNDSSLWESGFQVVGGLLRFANLSRFTPAPPGRLFCWGVVLRAPALSYRSRPPPGRFQTHARLASGRFYHAFEAVFYET